MRNMTITVDEDTAEWVRIYAARHHTSVSRFVGEMLAERKRREEGYAAAMENYLAGSVKPLTAIPAQGKPYPDRGALHER